MEQVFARNVLERATFRWKMKEKKVARPALGLESASTVKDRGPGSERAGWNVRCLVCDLLHLWCGDGVAGVVSEITTAEGYLLMKLFEAEGEAESAIERLKEIESGFQELLSMIHEGPEDGEPAQSFVERLEIRARHHWAKVYVPDEELTNPNTGKKISSPWEDRN